MGDHHENPADSDSDPSWEIADSASSPDLEPPGQHDPRSALGQRCDFWMIEVKARVLNGHMTPYERYCLEQLPGLPPVCQSDLKKVIRNFGRPIGATAPCRRLIKYLAHTQGRMRIGQLVSVKSPLFTLCKHQLISDRSQTEELDEGPLVHGCSCLAKTYFQPEGCRHKLLDLYYRDRFLPMTLCKTCSTCMRCKKLLGHICMH